MDETRTRASDQTPGHVEPTPEAEPLDTLDLRVAGAAETAGGDAPPSSPTPTPIRPELGGRAEGSGGVAERLKPVAAAAEEVAAAAVALSAKGLSRLAAILEERRQRRTGGDQAG